MPVKFRTYNDDTRFGEDYYKLRDFLIALDDSTYTFGRWDWMITHSMLQPEGLPRIGIWEDGGEVVALATYDTMLGNCYFPRKPVGDRVLRDMLTYAEQNLTDADGKAKVLIRDGDEAMQNAAASLGFLPTQDKECDAVFPIEDFRKIAYTLPDGFSITSMKDTPDFYKYGEVLWKGFNHELNGEGAYTLTPEEYDDLKYRRFERPNLNPDIKIAVVAPDGNFVSYCGMWQDAKCQSAIVEPVATDPAYRKMGLGRAAVLEGVKRCGKLGAKRAFVGSSQQFYYQIGFRPFATSTFWEVKRG